MAYAADLGSPLPEAMPALEAVSLLSMPKSAVCKDELSGRPASFQLRLGALAFYYSTPDTAAQDYATLRHVFPLLQQIREEESAGGNTAERAIRAVKVRHATAALAAACGRLAAERCRSGQHATANPAALRYLRALGVLHGEGSVELVPGLLALAESCLGLGPLRASSASEMLFTGTSILATAARASGGAATHHPLHCRLQLLYGRLALGQRKLPEALEAFSRALFHAAAAGGPEHLACAPCLYLMGTAFQALGRSQPALDCAERATQVYALHLSGERPAGAAAVGYHPPPRPAPGSVDAAFAATPPGQGLSAQEHSEALEALQGIVAAREAAYGGAGLAVAEARWVLARVHAAAGEKEACLECIDRGVVEAFTAALGGEHARVAEVVSLRKQLLGL